jgi:hypothetical protein
MQASITTTHAQASICQHIRCRVSWVGERLSVGGKEGACWPRMVDGAGWAVCMVSVSRAEPKGIIKQLHVCLS